MPETIVNGSIVQTVTDDAYAAGWDGSNDVPTKNAIYDKIQSLGSSGLTPIKTQAFSGVSSVAFINGTSSVVFDGTYKAYLLVYRLNPATDAVNLYLRTIPSGSTPDSGASDYAYKNYTVTNSVSNSDSNGAAQIRLDGDNIGNAAGEGQTGFIIFHDPADTTLQKQLNILEQQLIPLPQK